MNQLQRYGRPLFLVVSGSDSFGFPSHDSDIDVKGVYLAPSERFLELRKRENEREPTFEYMSPDRRLDVSIDGIGKYLGLLGDSNGDRMEWPSSRLIIFSSPEFQGLKNLVDSAALNKRVFYHYLNFARDVWKGKKAVGGVKKDLYTLRTYMTGINLLETGEVERDITCLNNKFQIEAIPYMLKAKEKGELSAAEGYKREQLEEVVKELDARLLAAVKNSKLPEAPDYNRLNDYLIELRKKSLGV